MSFIPASVIATTTIACVHVNKFGSLSARTAATCPSCTAKYAAAQTPLSFATIGHPEPSLLLLAFLYLRRAGRGAPARRPDAHRSGDREVPAGPQHPSGARVPIPSSVLDRANNGTAPARKGPHLPHPPQGSDATSADR